MPAVVNPPTVDELVAALSAAGGDLDREGRQVALSTYRLLAQGRPAAADRIAADAGVASETVDRLLGEWPGVFRDADGGVVGFWGLALEPLEPTYGLCSASGDSVGYAWCAWDTLFLPTLLGQVLDVTAADAETGEPIGLTVAPDGVRRTHPPATVVSFLAPEGAWDADVMTTFCHKVLFFADGHQAAAWIGRHRDALFTLPVHDAFEVGRRWTRARYGDALG